MFQSLKKFQELILEKWQDLERKLVVPREMKDRHPFNEEETDNWDPKIDIRVERWLRNLSSL